MDELEEYRLLEPRLIAAIRGKTKAKAIAEAMYQVLREFARDVLDHNPDIEVQMWTPAQIKERGGPHGPGCYVVNYEAGPYNWGIMFSMCDELKRLMEPYYSFDLCIYPGDDGQVAA